MCVENSPEESSSVRCFVSLKVLVTLANSVDPDETQSYAAFHPGPHCLSKYLFRSAQYTTAYPIRIYLGDVCKHAKHMSR